MHFMQNISMEKKTVTEVLGIYEYKLEDKITQ